MMIANGRVIAAGRDGIAAVLAAGWSRRGGGLDQLSPDGPTGDQSDTP
jgi:hypothetical protein